MLNKNFLSKFLGLKEFFIEGFINLLPKQENFTNVLPKLEEFIKLLPQLSQIALLMGSIPFLVYFYSNGFFPSIELFNYISLISLSFILSILFLIGLTIFWVLPGIFWKISISDDFKIKRRFYSYNSKFLDDDYYYKNIIINYLIFPFFILEFINIPLMMLIKHKETMNFILTTGPIIMAICTTSTFFYKLKLPITIYFIQKLFFTGYSLFFLHVIFFFILLFGAENIADNTFYFILTAVAEIIGISFISIAIQFSKISISIAMTTIFTLFLLYVTSRYPILSGGLMKNLHIGNYQAEQIYLTQEACQRLQSIRLLNITENCSLQNITVLWSMGDQYVLKVPIKNNSELLFLKTQDVILLQKKIDQTEEQSSNKTSRH